MAVTGKGRAPLISSWWRKTTRLRHGLASISRQIQWADSDAADETVKLDYFFDATPAASQRIRYVNTASTAGGDGTTNATTGASRAYVGMSDALTAEASNLRNANVYLTIYVEGSADDTWDGKWPSGFVTDATHYIEIVGNSTANGRNTGVWDASKYTLSNSDYYAATTLTVPYVKITNIQIENTANDSSAAGGIQIVLSAPTGIYWIVGNIIRYNPSGTPTTSGGNGGIYIEDGTNNRTVFAVNNIIYGFKDGQIYIYTSADSEKLYAYNNTLAAGNIGLNLILYGTNDTVKVRNNILSGNTTDFSLTDSATTYVTEKNVTSDATSPDGASFQTQTVTFAGAGDYRLSTSDTGAKNRSSDLSADADYAFSTDIIGTTRSGSWDVGAFEVVAAGSVGSASGSSTVTGIGASGAPAVGSSSGSSVVTGVGASSASSVGSASGGSTVTGISTSTASSVGSSLGSSTVAGISVASAPAVGSASGTSTVTGVGASGASSVGAATGSSTVTGVGVGSAPAVGSALGSSTVLGVAESSAASVGSAFGSSTVTGISTSSATAVGSSSGTSTVNGVSQSFAEGVGSAFGTSTVLGVSESEAAAVGAASGSSTVTGVSESLANAVGAASGTSVATGVSQAQSEAVGSSSGDSTVLGVGSYIAGSEAAGSAFGSSTVLGVSESQAQGVGSSFGSSTALGVSEAQGIAVGSASGSSTVLGVGESSAASVGSASGSSTVLGVSGALSAARGRASGSSAVNGVGSYIVQPIPIPIDLNAATPGFKKPVFAEAHLSIVDDRECEYPDTYDVFKQDMAETVGLALESPDLNYVVYGHQTPSQNSQGLLWVNLGRNREFATMYYFANGEWVDWLQWQSNVHRLIGDSQNPPEGYLALDGSTAVMPDMSPEFRGTAPYQLYYAIWIGIGGQ